jgi:hypothetical protein
MRRDTKHIHMVIHETVTKRTVEFAAFVIAARRPQATVVAIGTGAPVSSIACRRAGRDGSRSTLVSELTALYRDLMDPSALSLAGVMADAGVMGRSVPRPALGSGRDAITCQPHVSGGLGRQHRAPEARARITRWRA